MSLRSIRQNAQSRLMIAEEFVYIKCSMLTERNFLPLKSIYCFSALAAEHVHKNAANSKLDGGETAARTLIANDFIITRNRYSCAPQFRAHIRRTNFFFFSSDYYIIIYCIFVVAVPHRSPCTQSYRTAASCRYSTRSTAPCSYFRAVSRSPRFWCQVCVLWTSRCALNYQSVMSR